MTSPASSAPFGRYELQSLLARGGMGEVFRAVAKGAGGFEKPVVVKRIHPQFEGSPELAAMFVAEARVMSKLVHPNIVQVLDFGAGEDDDYFMVMELVDGVDLGAFERHQRKKMRPPDLGLLAYLGLQVLRGLHHAHKTAVSDDGRVIVHRDVSPGNVLLSRVGEVKVADFGIALATNPQAGDEPTTAAGKLGFMAPEQHRGEAVDARADVFSTGVVMHKLLTGELPFGGANGEERQRAAAEGAFARADVINPSVPTPLAEVIAQALAPRPEDRFATARAMSEALRKACAVAGITIADADALADAVDEVTAAQPKRPRLVPVERRELTRHAAGAFTMTVTREGGSVIGGSVIGGSVIGASEVGSVIGATHGADEQPTRAEPTPAEARPADERGRGLWLVGGGLVVAGVLAGVALLSGGGDEAAPAGTASASAATSAPVPQSSASETAPSSSTAAPTPTGSSAPPPVIRSRPLPPPSPSVALPRPKPAEPSCTGKVLLAGKGSWWVSGGPARVQAPGQYTWPCGTYALTGTSRADGRTRGGSVTVTQGGLASARFE